MRNINIGYDAFRIICPAQELTIRQGELATLQKQADANPATWKIKRSWRADSTSWEQHWLRKAILRMRSRISTRNSANANKLAQRRTGGI